MSTVRVNDKVVYIGENKVLSLRLFGTVVRIELSNSVEWEDGEERLFRRTICSWRIMTVHKAQGSTLTFVSSLNIPTMASVLDRRWIYGCYKGKVVSVSFQLRSVSVVRNLAKQKLAISISKGLKEDDIMYK
jgi:hypothetical protein